MINSVIRVCGLDYERLSVFRPTLILGGTMTDDEIRERIKYLEMDEGDGVPGARFAREMGEEVLSLRTRLDEATALINAAVELMTTEQVSKWAGVRAWLEGEE